LTRSQIARQRRHALSAHPQKGSALHCGKVSLEVLAKRFGTPLYVYSADQIVERLTLFQQAFAGRDHLVCYSVKVNSALAILKLLAARGAGFDIVSGGELERVRAAAPEAVDRVVFSGVGKTALRRSIWRSTRESSNSMWRARRSSSCWPRARPNSRRRRALPCA
jgi:hypothetical protein